MFYQFVFEKQANKIISEIERQAAAKKSIYSLLFRASYPTK